MNIQKYILFSVAFLMAFSLWGQQENFRQQAPVAGPAPKLQFGDFTDFKLDNGLRVILVENHKLPRVSFQLFVDRPIILEGEYAGTGEVMGQLLRSGTELRTKTQIDEAVDFVGANFSTNSRGGTISGLSRHAETLVSLMADCLLNPVFPEEEFTKIVKQNESGLAFQQDDPEAIATNISNQVRFGSDHPYGERMSMQSLANLTSGACRNFYSRYFRPQISYLVVVGDIDVAQTRTLAEKYFGDWGSEGKLFVEFFDYPQAPNGREVSFVPRASAVQSVINVTYPVILKPGSKNAIAANLLNQILGGGSNGRLFLNLREDKAYTYGAYSDLEADPNIGYFNAYLNVRNEVTDSAVEQVLLEMERLRKEEVSEKELQEAKSLITGAFARSLEQPEAIARFALNTVRYRLARNYYPNYLENLAQIKPADIRKAAQEFLLPNRAHVVVVGNRSAADKLRRFAADEEVVYYSPQGTRQEPMGMLTMEGITAEQVIDDYVRAIGGQERLLEISDLSTEMEATVQGMQMTMRQEKKVGSKMHLTVNMSGMAVNETVLNGAEAKVLQMGAEQPVDEATLTELQEQAQIFPEARFRELGYSLEFNGTEIINDKKAYIIQITSPSAKVLVEYYDTSTGLKLRTVTTSDAASITIDYDDYQEVDGIKYPHKITSKGLMPAPIVFSLKSLSINDGLKDSRFQVR